MTPPLVQEALAPTPRIGQEQFTFLLCQHGTEPTLKARWLGENSQFRLAFSRPGLLTFKMSEALPPDGADREVEEVPTPWSTAKIRRTVGSSQPEQPTPADSGQLRRSHATADRHAETSEPHAGASSQQAIAGDWMVRLAGLVLGQVKGDLAEAMVDEALALAGSDWDAAHVVLRDTGLPGLKGFEPGPSLLCDEIGATFAQRWPADKPAPRINSETEVGKRVLDIVLVDPQHWLVGYHVVERSHERWPGGAYSAPAPNEMISRAYLKMAEALAWSGLPIQPGDSFVEIGSAPGGSCQRLLDLGLKVTGIDPAEMDPMLLEHPRFEHWRFKSSGVRRKMYSKFRWLAADANVAPNYTLDCVEDIVNYKTSHIAGLLLTLKLSNYDLAAKMDEYIARVRSWGYARVEVRQLASNRRECCLVAERH